MNESHCPHCRYHDSKNAIIWKQALCLIHFWNQRIFGQDWMTWWVTIFVFLSWDWSRESSWVEACHGAISRRLGIERISIIPRFEIPYSFFLQTAPVIDQAIWGKNWYSICKPVMIERQPCRDIFDLQNVFIIITTIDLFQKLKYLLLNKAQYLHSYWQIVQNFIINIS